MGRAGGQDAGAGVEPARTQCAAQAPPDPQASRAPPAPACSKPLPRPPTPPPPAPALAPPLLSVRASRRAGPAPPSLWNSSPACPRAPPPPPPLPVPGARGLLGKMWGQVGCAGPWEPHPGHSSCQPRSGGDRKRRGNYTNTLRELAQMLPVPLHTSYKKLTKKEILLHILRYIEHLQASISTTTALLQLQCGEKEEFGVGASRHVEMSACQRGRRDSNPHGTPRRRRARLLNVGKKPRKGKRSRRSERRGVNKEARRSLSLGQSPSQPGQLAEADLRVAGKGALLSPGTKQLLFQFSRRDPALGSRWPTGSTFLDRAEGSVPGRAADWCVGCDREEIQEDDDMCSACEARLIYREQRWYDRSDQALLGQERQELVQYHSCGEEEDDGPDAGPWLSTQSPGCGSRESSLLCSPGSGGRIGACWASKDLGLSPSLFSSPGRLLPRHVLQGGPEELSQGLFEDVCLSPQSPGSCDSLAGALQRKSGAHQTLPDAPLNSLNVFQSAFSLDHCYLSFSEASKTDSSPGSGVTELMAACGQLLQECLPGDGIHRSHQGAGAAVAQHDEAGAEAVLHQGSEVQQAGQPHCETGLLQRGRGGGGDGGSQAVPSAAGREIPRLRGSGAASPAPLPPTPSPRW
ncbi:meiosis initiator protein isoform X2 [Emydura macquarii macquarii]|uniref:meiosis initiator protein isoform X2 n=1 Tax=Emydura macquarii macquarii TaxID=1129001 RepID=UPI00352BB02E